VRDYSPSIGSELLRVTLVEFLDPECESCAFFHPIVKGVLKKYEGRIRYVVRYAPFHGNSKYAISILDAARKQGKYWEALDLMFLKLPEWGNHHAPKPELILTFLPALNLDMEKLKVDMNDPAISKMIEQEITDGMRLQVRQTPTFFVNGQILNLRSENDLAEAIEAAM
jgi:protein-disulfide isomerase